MRRPTARPPVSTAAAASAALALLLPFAACRPPMKLDPPFSREARDQMLGRVNAAPGGGARVAFDGERRFTDTLRVERYRLDNGLRVVVMEDHAAPVFAFQLWYGVGSKHERPGKTGIAHLFEHLLFKESKGLGDGVFDRIMEMNGGDVNASTWVDWTFYRESLPTGPPSLPGVAGAAGELPAVLSPPPVDRLELVVRLEAERMANMILDDEQVGAELEVVKNERRYRVDNDPEGKMYEVLYQAAYDKHPYGWPTIGWMADLEGLDRADCTDFYGTWYSPNNTTVVVTGDVRTERVLDLLRTHMGPLASKELPAYSALPDPPQAGERRRSLEMPLAAAKILAGFHVPSQLHPDYAAVEVANEILLGGRSGRLYRKLVTDLELASDADGWVSPFAEPGILEVMVTLKRDKVPGDVEPVLWAAVEELRNAPPSAAEVAKARARLEAEFLRELRPLAGRAEALGHYETTAGDFGALFGAVDSWQAVDPEDVRRVAEAYLGASNRTVVVALPKADGGADGDAQADDGDEDGDDDDLAAPGSPGGPAPATPPANDRAASGSPGDVGSPRPTRPVHRVDLANGVHGILVEDHSLAHVDVAVTVKVGAAADPPGKAGLARITAEMLLRGAAGRTRAEIEEAVDAIGSTLEAGAAHTSLSLDGDALTRNTRPFLELLRDVVQTPTFPEDELARLKRETESEIEGLRDDDQALAAHFFRRHLYGDHPYGGPPLGTLTSVRGITRDDVVAFYKRHFVGGNVVVSAAGDMDADGFADALRAGFGGLPAGAPTAARAPAAPRPAGRRVLLVDKPERTQTQVYIGHDGVAASHPDRAALAVVNTAFGGTFTARLMQEIRVEKGWSYGAYSRMGLDRDAGAFHMWVFPKTEDTAPAVARTVELYESLARDGLTDAELAFAKTYLEGAFAFTFETPGRLADELVRLEVLGLPRDHLEGWVDEIRAVTADDLRRVAREHFHPQDMLLVVLCTASDLKEALGRLPGVAAVEVAPYDSE